MDSATAAYNGVETLYQQQFHRPPEWIVRCPGRVNLIGLYFRENIRYFKSFLQENISITMAMAYYPWPHGFALALQSEKVTTENCDLKTLIRRDISREVYSEQCGYINFNSGHMRLTSTNYSPFRNCQAYRFGTITLWPAGVAF